MIEQREGDMLIRVKAVPGASNDKIAGVLAMPGGDRLKVRICAPPENGKANKAICVVIATALGVRPKQVTIESGHASPEKVVRVHGLGGLDGASGLDELRARLLGA